MFTSISISNILSYRDEQTIDFIASKEKKHLNDIYKSDNKKILPLKIFFGPNASGKSNLIKAIDFFVKILVKNKEFIPNLNHKNYLYRGKTSSTNPICSFKFKLLINQLDFSYTVKMNLITNIIVYEELLQSNKQYFKREFIDGRTVLRSRLPFFLKDSPHKEINELQKTFKEFAYYPNKDRVFLIKHLASKFSPDLKIFRCFYDIYKDFQNILIIYPNSKYGNMHFLAQEDFQDKLSSYCSEFDISNLQVKSKSAEQKELFEGLNDEDTKELNKIIIDEVINNKNTIKIRLNKSYYEVKLENDQPVFYKLNIKHDDSDDFEFFEESDGIQRLFDFFPILIENDANRLILIDEIDRSFHTKITQKLIQMFLHLNHSSDSFVQFVITSHDINLLNSELLRKDEISFISKKDNSSAISELSSYKLRTERDVLSDYLKNKFGALPNISL